MKDKRFRKRVARNKLLQRRADIYMQHVKDETLSVYDRFAGYTDGFIDAMRYYQIWTNKL